MWRFSSSKIDESLTWSIERKFQVEGSSLIGFVSGIMVAVDNISSSFSPTWIAPLATSNKTQRAVIGIEVYM